MAAIVLRNFGGMAPSANPVTLPEGQATYAKNLDTRYGDFRPLALPEDQGVPMTAGATLYRFENSGWFITNPNEVNYVRGPIANDATERTYYTGDGVPKVVNQFNDVRQLGVPQPANPPAVVVNGTDEFSTEDAQASMPGSQEKVMQQMWANLNQSYTGLADADIAALGFVATSDPWRFKFAIAGTLDGTVFTPTNPVHRVLMSDKLGFYLETVGLVTTGYVDVYLRGMQYAFDASFSADLQAISDPSDPAGLANLIPADVAGAIIDTLAQPLATMQAARTNAVAQLKLLAEEFKMFCSASTPATEAGEGAVGDFYAGPGIDGVIEKTFDDMAKMAFDAVQTYSLNEV